MNCVICANRGKAVETDGHCCPGCRNRIDQDLSRILDLAAAAAAWQPPKATSAARPTFGSRPPLSLDGIDPELTLIDLIPGDSSSRVPLLDALESWERAIREDRGFMPYGPASALRARQHGASTAATLTGVITFLKGQLDWATTEPSFGLEDFAAHIRAAVRALARYGTQDQPATTVALCPTLTDDGECRYRLRYIDLHDQVKCPRCGAARDAITLIAIAISDGRKLWLDAGSAAQLLGVSEPTLRRMAQRGQIERSRGKYCVSQEQIVV